MRVTIENRRITQIDILEHEQMLGQKAEPVIPQRMIEQQSTNVDAVSGATNNSNVIMNAVQNAIEQAYN